jgi:hypothetical protein
MLGHPPGRFRAARPDYTLFVIFDVGGAHSNALVKGKAQS